MATTITINPVVPSSDGGYQLLTQSIMAGQEVKRKQEAAIQEAIAKQNEVQQKLWGDYNKNIQQFYKDAPTVPAQIKNQILQQAIEDGTNALKSGANIAEVNRMLQERANNALMSYQTYDSFYKGTVATAKELSEQLGMDEGKIINFANKFAYSGGIPSVGDPAAFIKDEVAAHPELYVNVPKLHTAAAKEMEEITKKDAEVSSDLKLDPTGKKTISLGYKYKLSPFETEEEKTDDVTGLKYKVPVLKETPSKISIPGTTTTYNELDPVKYDKFINQAGPMTNQRLFIAAINMINEHNAKAFEAAGLANPKDQALAVSKNNIGSWEQKNIPGFINPFSDANIENFKRIYAKDFLKSIKAYDENTNEAKGFALNRGVDTPKPSQVTVNVGQEGPTEDKFKIYHPTTIIQGIVEDRGGFRGNPVKVSGVEDALDVTDAFSSFKPSEWGGQKSAYKRVYYSPSKQRFYYSTKTTGALTGQSPDQFTSSIIQAAPDIGAKPDSKSFRSLPPKAQGQPASSGIKWK